MSTVFFNPTCNINDHISNIFKDDACFGAVSLQDEIMLECSFKDGTKEIQSIEATFEQLDFLFHNYKDVLPSLIQCNGILYPIEYLISK